MKEVIAYDAIFECQTARNPTTLLDPLAFQQNIVRVVRYTYALLQYEYITVCVNQLYSNSVLFPVSQSDGSYWLFGLFFNSLPC